eukprot:TRINITY_DN19972_c0_g1_i1.p1 TRINITY_DN19972_c0_g1~~TRINITY_DN19972_c0_g1_i1.p1  ORF type:complete len:261 (+),score=34.16 TRINITY_DN19972_c0_g1_i1:79-783(+)
MGCTESRDPRTPPGRGLAEPLRAKLTGGTRPGTWTAGCAARPAEDDHSAWSGSRLPAPDPHLRHSTRIPVCPCDDEEAVDPALVQTLKQYKFPPDEMSSLQHVESVDMSVAVQVLGPEEAEKRSAPVTPVVCPSDDYAPKYFPQHPHRRKAIVDKLAYNIPATPFLAATWVPPAQAKRENIDGPVPFSLSAPSSPIEPTLGSSFAPMGDASVGGCYSGGGRSTCSPVPTPTVAL